MYPLLTMNSKKITENAKAVTARARKQGVSVTAITKCFGGNTQIARALLNGGVTALGDSRIRNLKNFADLDCQKWLIRIPMLSECEQAVTYADVSLNSELSTIRALNDAAKRLGRTHGILLMIDVGDLREGWFLGDGATHSDAINQLADGSFHEILDTIEEILAMEHITFMGIGANETCFGGTIPTEETFAGFLRLANIIKETYHLPCPVISGGNSSSYYLLDTGTLPSDINNLRFGEIILFGRESAFDTQYSYLNHDSFLLEVEIVEMKEKPSCPIGMIGADAFGHVPHFTDRGIRRRAICALGQQDTCIEHLTPLDTYITIEGGSSDHMILDVTDSRHHYQVGDIIRLRCDYVSSLRICTSDYVKKLVVNR